MISFCKINIVSLALGLFLFSPNVFGQRVYQVPQFAKDWEKPGLHPDRIVINFSQDPSSAVNVTWRTSKDVQEGYAEIAVATPAPKFWRNATTKKAKTTVMDAAGIMDAQVISHYHTVRFDSLMPDTLYAYRVGDGEIWSEWIQFRTAAKESKPFSFLYVGDAQNYILELWSRLIREGYRKAPNASFIIHAGDLVSEAHHERQWHEWFTAGGWIHRMLPSIATPGNHEYRALNEEEKHLRKLSVQWKPQFEFPLNGPAGMEELEETVYYIDYQGTRIISLNSNRFQEEQVAWLENVLANNPNKWTVVTYHHPMYSASDGRDNEELRGLWKPVFDKYKVDLALQGHDHSYARGRVEPSENVLSGVNTRDRTGTVYVVSVSGGKMYKLRPGAWEGWEAERDRAAENTELFQVIHVNGDTLAYQAYTATGELYDAFEIVKAGDGQPNVFIEKKHQAIPKRRHDNTISYQDPLPDDIKSNLEQKYPGYEFNRTSYIVNDDFKGYRVQLEKGPVEVNLKIDVSGKILEEVIEKE